MANNGQADSHSAVAGHLCPEVLKEAKGGVKGTAKGKGKGKEQGGRGEQGKGAGKQWQSQKGKGKQGKEGKKGGGKHQKGEEVIFRGKGPIGGGYRATPSGVPNFCGGYSQQDCGYHCDSYGAWGGYDSDSQWI